MPDSIRIISNIGGVKKDFTNLIDNAGGINHNIPLPAGQAGTVGTTAETIGIPNNTLVAGNVVGIFWQGGQLLDATVASATTSSIAISGTPSLPAAGTPVVVSAQALAPAIAFNSAYVVAYSLTCDQAAVIEFLSAAPATLGTLNVLRAKGGTAWSRDMGLASQLTGVVASAVAYNKSTKAATLALSLDLAT